MSTAVAVRERPILFSGEMVRAILDGTKTQTRRVVKLPGDHAGFSLTRMQGGYPDGVRPVFDDGDDPNAFSRRCPYGQPGDRLWVRETWGVMADKYHRIAFAADTGHNACGVQVGAIDGKRWRPSIHMPRHASRLTLEITDVRVERVQDISEDDAIAEGVDCVGADNSTHRAEFMRLWDSLNAHRGYGWDANPFVWVLAFRRVV